MGQVRDQRSRERAPGAMGVSTGHPLADKLVLPVTINEQIVDVGTLDVTTFDDHGLGAERTNTRGSFPTVCVAENPHAG